MEKIKTTELSIVILCYRAEEEIIPFVEEIKSLVSAMSDSFEIVLVGNYIEGSLDRTREVIAQIAQTDTCFQTVCKPKEGMMGWDMKEGLAIANGKYLCVIDGDGQYPVESIRSCYKEIKSGKYGLVKTYRRRREDGIIRTSISVIYNLLFALLFPYVRSKDVNSKPKMFTPEVYEQMQLTSDDWFIDAEVMIRLGQMGIPFYEFPIDFYALKGRSSFVRFPAIVEFMKNLFLFRFKKYRL
ncbi:MAG TPA: glycosyltransferase family 2 protein [Prolixibacteraceae bacterium]|nr:glycosyltransferase family 2 protein [Prolixibacteraceae bacterium]